MSLVGMIMCIKNLINLMKNSNNDKSSSWKNWLIKKLLSNNSSKEEILKFIATDEKEKNSFEDFDDNNEKNLINNILQLSKKSVDDIMDVNLRSFFCYQFLLF